MHVAIIGSRGYRHVYSGYETFVRELADRMVKAGIEVTVYCHKNLYTTFPAVVNNVRLVYIGTIEGKTTSQFLHSLQAMAHACRKPYDIILTVNAANGPFGLFTRLCGRKTAINVDGLEWLRPKWKGLGARYFYWAAKMATKLYDVVVTDSREMQKIYRSEFNRDTTFIPYGAIVQESRPPAHIHQWGLEPGQYYLIVGRLVPDNNADLIMREFAAANSPCKLVLVGDVPYRDRYAEQIKAAAGERLIITGYIRDQETLSELYCHCSAYVHGHEFGGTNPSLLEALAHGCAVCALDTVFSREVLANGEYGLLFTKEPGSLARLLQSAERNPEKLLLLRQKAKQRITAAYNWEAVTGSYLSLFEKMLNGK